MREGCEILILLLISACNWSKQLQDTEHDGHSVKMLEYYSDDVSALQCRENFDGNDEEILKEKIKLFRRVEVSNKRSSSDESGAIVEGPCYDAVLQQ